MQVSVETTGPNERRVTVGVPEERISEAVEKRLKELARTVKIKGFRPGKVPMQVVRQRYTAEVRSEVIGDVVQTTWYEAVETESLQPIGQPSIEPAEAADGEGLRYVATFEVMPEVKANLIEGKPVEKLVAEVNEADVDAMLEKIRSQRKEWVDVDRAAAAGDQAVIDFTGSIDGAEFDGGKATEFPLEIGAGRMIPGFEEGVTGHKAGEQFDIEVTFPDDYQAKHLAGKTATFAINVHKVQEARLPELTDEFLAQFGVTEGGVEAFRKEVRSNMERELSRTLRARLREAVMEALLEANPIEVPSAMVAHEAQNLLEQMRNNLVQQGMPASSLKMDPSMFNDQAKRRVALGLLIHSVISDNGIALDPERVRAEVERFAQGYDDPQQVIDWHFSEPGRLTEFENVVLEDQVVDFLLEKAKVSEKPVSFDEIMNSTQTA